MARPSTTSGIVAVEGPPWKMVYAGSVGDEISIEDAQKSAALAMCCTLANLKGALGGSLDRVDRFVKLMGFVRCRPDFMQAPTVINGASEVLLEIFGQDRLPARLGHRGCGAPRWGQRRDRRGGAPVLLTPAADASGLIRPSHNGSAASGSVRHRFSRARLFLVVRV